jgi:hypothetical protein
MSAPIDRQPYVGHGADGARRSAAIDREEAATLDRDEPRHALLLASAEKWEQQAERETEREAGDDDERPEPPDHRCVALRSGTAAGR